MPAFSANIRKPYYKKSCLLLVGHRVNFHRRAQGQLGATHGDARQRSVTDDGYLYLYDKGHAPNLLVHSGLDLDLNILPQNR